MMMAGGIYLYCWMSLVDYRGWWSRCFCSRVLVPAVSSPGSGCFFVVNSFFVCFCDRGEGGGGVKEYILAPERLLR